MPADFIRKCVTQGTEITGIKEDECGMQILGMLLRES